MSHSDPLHNQLRLAWDDITQAQLAFPDAGIEEGSHDYLGLWTVEVDGCEYAIGTDDECYRAVYAYCKDSVWAFNTEFIIQHSNIPGCVTEVLRKTQASQCESCNDELLEAINDFNEFVSDAIDADGRGHFLASYDGDEIELGNNLFAYRIN